MTHRILVGTLALILATCSGWCTRLHHHGEGLGHAAEEAGTSGKGAEAPRPINDDNCACAGALPQLESAATAGFSSLTPLPLDHPFNLALACPALSAAGERLADTGEILRTVDAAKATLRALRLRC